MANQAEQPTTDQTPRQSRAADQSEGMDTSFRIWDDYLASEEAWAGRRHLIARNDIREGCEPFTLVHQRSDVEHAVVLLHGLTDSPWYMRDIGRCLHQQLGANVFVPLLHGHGLRDPAGMRGVSHRVWLHNAVWALRTARASARRVSVGGLSTGGALATLLAFRDQDRQDLIEGAAAPHRAAPHRAAKPPAEPLINGGVLLFSAALRLKNTGILRGHTKEVILRTPFARFGDQIGKAMLRLRKGRDPLSGDDRFRYSTMDLGAAAELARVIRLLDLKRKPSWFSAMRGLKQPLFIAHSEADDTADIRALHNLQRVSAELNPGQVVFFRIGQTFQVPHASIVLDQIAFGNSGSPIEPANPCFDTMMRCAINSSIFR